MNIDPFKIKRFSKAHPLRIVYTLYSRGMEIFARVLFKFRQLPLVTMPTEPSADYSLRDTAVTPQQMAALITALKLIPSSLSGSIVEIGSYRGVTTRKMSESTNRHIYAVDPFAGYGGAEADLEIFRSTVAGLSNVIHLQSTSGEAANKFSEPVAYIFVDAVHDYVNTKFDVNVWSAKLVQGGFLAMHDVDNVSFAGTNLAAWQASRHFELICHIHGLVIFRKN
jgi:hypothetical protein